MAVWLWRWYRAAPRKPIAPVGRSHAGRPARAAGRHRDRRGEAAVVAAVRRPPLETTLLYLQPVVRRVVVAALASLVVRRHRLRRGLALECGARGRRRPSTMHPALDPGIQTIQVREDGLVGTFYQPRTPPPWPAGDRGRRLRRRASSGFRD